MIREMMKDMIYNKAYIRNVAISNHDDEWI